MHEAYELVRAVTVPKQICYFNVDCVAATIAKAHRPALAKAVAACVYPDGAPKFRLKGGGTKIEYSVDGSPGASSLPVTNHTLEYNVPPWQDTAESDGLGAELLRTVDAGQSLLLIGVGGTGKTYLAKEIIAHLKAAGQRVEVVALTHLAAQNIGVARSTTSCTQTRATAAGW
jgi:Cdc6-like AAA superfamily ATPase